MITIRRKEEGYHRASNLLRPNNPNYRLGKLELNFFLISGKRMF